MKKLSHLVSILSFCILALSSTSHALEFGVIGGLNSSSPSISAGNVDANANSGGGYDLGAFFMMGLVSDFSIEVDGLFQHKNFSSGITQFTMNNFLLPTFLRYSLIPLFNVGLGPYWGAGVGDVTTAIGNTSTSHSYGDSGLIKNDFGFTTSLQFKFPITPVNSLVLDGRYQFGLTNLSNTANGNFKTRGFQLLAGIGFGI